MPLYEYECAKGHRFEKIEKFTASAVKKCPVCGGKAERQISQSAVQFKGSGWYVTDYGGKSASGDGAKKDKPEAKADAKAETKTDSKADSKTVKSSDGKVSASSEKKTSSKSKE